WFIFRGFRDMVKAVLTKEIVGAPSSRPECRYGVTTGVKRVLSSLLECLLHGTKRPLPKKSPKIHEFDFSKTALISKAGKGYIWFFLL
ncbi:MAG: hypothetical protein ACQET7_03075, partial [Thermodesulfobacteriota bacterium]